jgi:hypothetical protein
VAINVLDGAQVALGCGAAAVGTMVASVLLQWDGAVAQAVWAAVWAVAGYVAIWIALLIYHLDVSIERISPRRLACAAR